MNGDHKDRYPVAHMHHQVCVMPIISYLWCQKADRHIVLPLSREASEVDREWYDCDEGEAVDLSHNPFLEMESTGLYLGQSRAATSQQDSAHLKRRQRIKEIQYNRDNELWEANRLRTSGILHRLDADKTANVFDPTKDEDHLTQSHAYLVVTDAKAPFLENLSRTGTRHGGWHQGPEYTQPVKDPTSDIAMLARRGSAVVKEARERKERARQMRTLEGAGTMLGSLMGKQQMTTDRMALSSSIPLALEAPRPSTTSSDSGSFRSLKQQRESLPAFACRKELLRIIRENPVVIVVGETGSGKTTQLTQYLLEEGYGKFGMIGCTQPRRVAAMSVAKRVAEEVGCPLGNTVGYAIRFEDCTTAGQTLIKYMTDGVMLREALREPDLDSYSAIIIDEAHERSLQTDVLLGLLRQIVTRRRDIKLIVTSATMDADRFANFFGGQSGAVPIYRIPGRTFPVEVLFSRTTCEDHVDAAVKQALTVHLTRPSGDILIFMTGQEDIEATCEIMGDRLASLEGPVPPLDILPIYSQMPADLQARIFEKASPGHRKCVVATNIAETSLTLDGIVFVIDTGLAKVKVYNPRIGMDALQVAPVSQAGAQQRAGRAGRTGPGICFRLYTEGTFCHDLLSAPVPEIQRTNLSNVVLLLKSLGIENLLDFDFIDRPPTDNLITSMEQLWILGALDDAGKLTELGQEMVEFPLDPPLAKMVLAGASLGCAEEVLSIVAMLSVPLVFYRPRERLAESDAAREKFLVPESDHLTLLNVFNQWVSHGFNDAWCSKHFIQPKAMRKAQEVRQQLVDILSYRKIPLTFAGGDWDRIRRAIAFSYVHKSARVKNIGDYVNLRTGMPASLHPTSALLGLGYTPDYVVYHELILTSKEYMQCVTAVEPAWLASACPMHFTLRVNHFGGNPVMPTKPSPTEAHQDVSSAKVLDNGLITDQKELGDGKLQPVPKRLQKRRTMGF